jgi:hypothetical protein
MVSCAVHPLGITEISPRVDKLLKGGPTGSCRRTRQSSASGAADEMFALADFPVGTAVYEFNICPSGSPALAWTPPWVDGAPQSFSSADRQHHPLPRQESRLRSTSSLRKPTYTAGRLSQLAPTIARLGQFAEPASLCYRSKLDNLLLRYSSDNLGEVFLR